MKIKYLRSRTVTYITASVVYILSVAIIFGGIYSIMRQTQASGDNYTQNEAKNSKTANIRAVWIATVYNINYPSRSGLSQKDLSGELDTIINNVISLGANTIFFQVRPCSDALYKSDLFPQSKYVSGTRGEAANGGFDSLLYLTEKAHEKNISVHAWINPVRILTSTKEIPTLTSWEAATKHPEWTVEYGDGKLYYDIGIPYLRQYISDGVYEIVKNYSIDGVVFDDYFYPYPTRDDDGNICEFNDGDTYKKYGGKYSLEDFRRMNVSALIRMCSAAAKKADPDCLFGVSPCGIYKNTTYNGVEISGLQGYYDIYCDCISFAREGSVDYLAPQLYWSREDKNAPFLALLSYWKDSLRGTSAALIPCLAPYRYEDSSYESGEISEQLTISKSTVGNGSYALYGYNALIDPSLSVGDEVRRFFSLYDK